MFTVNPVSRKLYTVRKYPSTDASSLSELQSPFETRVFPCDASALSGGQIVERRAAIVRRRYIVVAKMEATNIVQDGSGGEDVTQAKASLLQLITYRRLNHVGTVLIFVAKSYPRRNQ